MTRKPNTKRIRLAVALLAFVALNVVGALVARAEDVPIVSMKRLAIGAQVGAQWQRDTATDTGFQSKPAVKLVPVYRLYGPESGMSRGSLALVIPAEMSLTGEHQARFGVFLSLVLWDGSDAR